MAAATGRRVVYSPLVEARLVRSDDDALPADVEESPRLERKAAPVAPPEPPMVLLAPGDSQNVGTQPEFFARVMQPGARAIVLLFGRADYYRRGIERAAVAAAVTLEPTVVADMLVGTPKAPLPEGDYIVALKDLDTGIVLSVSGVRLREANARWPARFQAMLAEQARYGDGRHDQARPRIKGQPLYSVTTAVYDVDPAFVTALADSILDQRYDDFEWVLLDNGSTRLDTQQVCRSIAARDSRVRYSRVEDNRHIIGGNRYLLEQARGTYIIPVDGDDILYPDALRILSLFIAERGAPDLLYTDEQKISLTGAPSDLMWRTSWSRLEHPLDSFGGAPDGVQEGAGARGRLLQRRLRARQSRLGLGAPPRDPHVGHRARALRALRLANAPRFGRLEPGLQGLHRRVAAGRGARGADADGTRGTLRRDAGLRLPRLLPRHPPSNGRPSGDAARGRPGRGRARRAGDACGRVSPRRGTTRWCSGSTCQRASRPTPGSR